MADLGFGLPPGTAVRTCLVATSLARRLDLDEGDVRDCFYTGLLMHVGCVAVAHESAAAFGDDIALNRAVARTNVADRSDVAATFLPELTRDLAPDVAARATAFALSRGVNEWVRRTDTGVCEVARDTAGRLGLPESTQSALYHVFEAWAGGSAPEGLRGDDIAIASRVARAAIDAAFFGQLGGVDAAVSAVRERAGRSSTPPWSPSSPPIRAVFSPRPTMAIRATASSTSSPSRPSSATPPSWGRWPPRSATSPTSRCRFCTDTRRRWPGWPPGVPAGSVSTTAVVDRVEVAGLLHDVGRVGVSNAVWEKPAPLTRLEWEQVRMHGYYSERILVGSPSLAPISHHRRHASRAARRLRLPPLLARPPSIPMTARLVAVADAFAAMVRPRPYRPALDAQQAAGELLAEAAGGRLDHDAAAAVLAEADQPVPIRRRVQPAGLERPRGRGPGAHRRRVQQCRGGRAAVHLPAHRRAPRPAHLRKIGVSTRAGAALFAVQHDLVRPNG